MKTDAQLHKLYESQHGLALFQTEYAQSQASFLKGVIHLNKTLPEIREHISELQGKVKDKATKATVEAVKKIEEILEEALDTYDKYKEQTEDPLDTLQFTPEKIEDLQQIIAGLEAESQEIAPPTFEEFKYQIFEAELSNLVADSNRTHDDFNQKGQSRMALS